jgi:hypothetical protein
MPPRLPVDDCTDRLDADTVLGRENTIGHDYPTDFRESTCDTRTMVHLANA